MPSGHHHRRRSPSPNSESLSSPGIRSPLRGHRSHRSHKPHRSSRNSPRDPPPLPSYYTGAYEQRPKLDNRQPELRRSLSEDTYRHISGNERRKDHGRGRDHDRRQHDSGDDYYYYDKHGHPHTRSLSNSSRSRSRSRSRGRHNGDRLTRHSTIDSLKPVVEDVLAAFGLVSAKHAKKDHRGRGHRSRSRDRDYHERDRNNHKSYKPSRSASRGGSRSDRRPHNDYVDTMMDPGRGPSTQSAALRAAITAAALEAFRTRKEFGGITPERLLRIAGAAIAAGGLDAIVQRDGQQEGGTRKLIESVIIGMESSSAFGHRIRRRHGLTTGDQMKYRLMHAATAKILDRPFGSKGGSLTPKSPRSRSSTRLSSLMKSMTVQ